MVIKPICNKCKKELKKFGAILFSPPDKKAKLKNFTFAKIAINQS